MTDRELIQQALTDLEALVAYIKGGEPDIYIQVHSIEELRERQAQPEQWGIDVLGGDWNKFALAAVAILKETK